MRVVATLTIDGEKETIIEGDSYVFDTGVATNWDALERKKVGFWLRAWRHPDRAGPNYQGRVFVPWSSCLYVQEVPGRKEETAEGSEAGRDDATEVTV
jgi:hypothetical protein